MGVRRRAGLIEDSLPGVAAAVAAGMTAIGFTGGGHCRPAHDSRLRAKAPRWSSAAWPSCCPCWPGSGRSCARIETAREPRLQDSSEPRFPQRELGVGRADEAGIPARPDLLGKSARRTPHRLGAPQLRPDTDRAHSRRDFTPRIAMRAFFALVLLSGLVAGCTPYIPVKPGFGTSAPVPAGDIRPNSPNSTISTGRSTRLLANQVCATPYQLYEEKAIGASPGRCAGLRPVPQPRPAVRP